MAFAAKLYQDDRSADRLAVDLSATLRKADLVPVDVGVEDLSASGFRIVTDEILPDGGEITIGISGLGRRRARVVRRDGNRFGCEFLEPVGTVELETALLGQTLVHADFGLLTSEIASGQSGATLPFDAFQQRLRQFRGPIIVAGAIVPWAMIIGGLWILFA